MAAKGHLRERAADDDPLLAHPDVSPLAEDSVSPEDRASIREAREDVEAGRTASLEEPQAKYENLPYLEG